MPEPRSIHPPADEPRGPHTPPGDDAAETESPRSLFLPLVCIIQFGLLVGVVLSMTNRPPKVVIQRPRASRQIDLTSAASVEALRAADEQLRQGLYRGALASYARIADAATDEELLSRPAELLYRIALCDEALRATAERPVSLYENVVERTSDVVLKAAAQLGQARVWYRAAEPERAEPLVRDLVNGIEGASPAEASAASAVVAEARLLLGLSLSAQEADPDAADPLVQPAIAVAVLDRPVEDALAWVSAAERAGDAAAGLEEPDANLAPVEPEPATDETAAAPEATVAPSEAQRILERAIAEHPEHPLVPAARLELGNLAHRRGDAAAAIAHYESLVGFRTTPVSALAAYNLGLTHRQQREFVEAIDAMEKFIDGDPGHPLAPQASVLLGRMRLDQGRWSLAEKQLLRVAGSSAASPDVRASAAVYGATALILLNNEPDIRRAADLLFEQRAAYRRPALKEYAAFLSAYARYRLFESERQRRNEGRFVVNALFAVGENPEWLDPSAVLVMGRAAGALGLREFMLKLYQPLLIQARSLKTRVQRSFATEEMQYQSAVVEYETASLRGNSEEVVRFLRDQAIEQLRGLTEGDEHWAREALLRLAAIELERHKPEEALAYCRELLAKIDPDRPAVLKLMGRAY
ncbi:MAG: tetratricopeptide repeat protein, partial [Planctomycetes bacterium]|nr:tetratricopeptide repeat protein [Planctomycetota bacterium]